MSFVTQLAARPTKACNSRRETQLDGAQQFWVVAKVSSREHTPSALL